MKYIWILFAIPTILIAQDLEFELEPEAFPVEINGWEPFSPWVGGFSESAPALADIDADDDLDLFIGEYSGNVAHAINIGTSNIPQFSWISAQYDSLRTINSFGRSNPDFWDLDADGDLDAVIGSGYVTYVENLGSPVSPAFISVPETLRTVEFYAVGTHVALIDIDTDNDGDLICGEYQGHLQYYRNIGTPESYVFNLEDDYWFDINVGGYSDPTFIDIDSDEDYDLFIGERYGKIWYYRNDGTPDTCDFVFVTDFFDSIDVGEYSSPEFADIDGDGDYDLFVGRDATSSSLMGDVFFYENTGTPENHQFELATKNYLTLDMGYFPVFSQIVDINGDQVLDLIVGSTNRLLYLQNNGNPSDPDFSFMEEGFQGVQEPGIKPFFVDIDDDGDYDLICGEAVIPTPNISLYLNNGTPTHPQLELENPAFVTNPDFDVNTLPVLADIDADGDYDLFVTDDTDHFFYYRNDGGPLWPNFVLQSNQWQGIQRNGMWRGFSFADLDEDDDLDLLIMDPQQENLFFYRNRGNPRTPNMVLETEEFLDSLNSYVYTPFLTDIDGDLDFDLFLGTSDGGLLFFRNTTGDTSSFTPPPYQKYPRPCIHIGLGPNPANPITWVTFNLPYPQKATLAVYNLLGQKVTTLAQGLQPPGSQTYFWNASNFSSGTYLIRLETDVTEAVQRVVVVK